MAQRFVPAPPQRTSVPGAAETDGIRCVLDGLRCAAKSGLSTTQTKTNPQSKRRLATRFIMSSISIAILRL
jgi:hypothetical protein